MSQNSFQSSRFDDQINFSELIRLLLNSKKKIIISILIFTVISVIINFNQKPSFKSIALLKIGEVEFIDGSKQLIQSPDDLISDIKIDLVIEEQLLDSNFKNALASIDFKIIENRIIEFELISDTPEKNEETMAYFFSYVEKSHSKKFKSINDYEKNQLIQKIENNQDEINYLEEKLLSMEPSELNLEAGEKALNLNLNFPKIAIETSDRLFKLSQDQKTLNYKLNKFNDITQITTLPINDIETFSEKPSIMLMAFLGIAIGFLFGIFLVLITSLNRKTLV